MRIFDVVACAALLLVPLGACLEAGTCLRNSDCPSADVCSVGACVPAPEGDALDGSVEEGGSEGASDAGSTAPDVTTSLDAGTDGASADASSDAKPDAADAADAASE